MIRSVLRKYFDLINYAVGQNTVGKYALLLKRSFAYILTTIVYEGSIKIIQSLIILSNVTKNN